MSRIPGGGATAPYGYPTMPRAYYYEPDVPEYQDSDVDAINTDHSYAWHSGMEQDGPQVPPSHVPNGGDPEMYRRNKGEGRYVMPPQQNQPAHYYYPSPVPLPLPPLYRRVPQRLPVPMARPMSPPYYHMGDDPMRHHHHHHQINWNNQPEMMYHRDQVPNQHLTRPNTAHLVRRPMTAGQLETPTVQEGKKHKSGKNTISVRTPRFYRRLANPEMSRRMSALCLPMATQPDPAKRTSKTSRHHLNQKIQKVKRTVTPKIKNSESDIVPVIETVERCGDDFEDTKASNMKALFSRYQKVFQKCNPEKIENETESSKSGHSKFSKNSSKKLLKKKISPQLLKPKLPPSLLRTRRSKRSSEIKMTRSETDSSNGEEAKLEIEPMTTEQLDRMLSEMGGQSGDSSPRANAQKHEMETIESNEICRMQNEMECRRRPSTNEESRIRPSTRQGERKMSCEKEVKMEENQMPASLNYAELTKLMEQHGIGSQSQHDVAERRQMSNSNETSHTTVANSRPQKRQQEDVFGDTGNMQRYSDKLSEISSPLTNRSKRSPWTASSAAAGDQPNRPLGHPNQVSQDDHSQIEIHQSKSYIVNLIDRALSREFRTMPEERPTSKPFMEQTVRTPNSISIVTPTTPTTITVVPGTTTQHVIPGCPCSGNKHQVNIQTNSGAASVTLPNQIKLDQELCLEIKQALSGEKPEQSIGNNVPQSEVGRETCRESDSPLSTGEESLCIKQLKRLRYGHLKHIQREMRKLEDLERFIDSYSSTENNL